MCWTCDYLWYFYMSQTPERTLSSPLCWWSCRPAFKWLPQGHTVDQLQMAPILNASFNLPRKPYLGTLMFSSFSVSEFSLHLWCHCTSWGWSPTALWVSSHFIHVDPILARDLVTYFLPSSTAWSPMWGKQPTFNKHLLKRQKSRKGSNE